MRRYDRRWLDGDRLHGPCGPRPRRARLAYYDHRADWDSIDRPREKISDQLTILAGADVDLNRRIKVQVKHFPSMHKCVSVALERLHRAALQTLVAREASFDISASGLREAARTPMQHGQVVEFHVRLVGQLVTTGSDLHVAGTIGAGFVRTFTMQVVTGIRAFSRCRNRIREQAPVSHLRR